MKKILTLTSVLLAVFMLTACLENNELTDAEDNSQTLKRDPVTYTIYVDSAANSAISSLGMGESEISVKSVNEKDFTFMDRAYMDRPESAVDSISFEINNKSYELTYRATRKNFSASSSSKFKDRQIVNIYMNDDKHVEILAESNELIFFLSNSRIKEAQETFTEADAVEAARVHLAEIYGADALDGYELIEYDSPNMGEDREIYTVSFVRKIFGYETNDIVSAEFDMAGNFVGLNAIKRGVAANAAKDLGEDEIKNAMAFINETFSSWDIGSAELVIDSEGDYYIKVGISRKNGEDIQAMQIHVNIR